MAPEGGAHHREGWAILSIVFSLGNCIFQVLYERKMCATAHLWRKARAGTWLRREQSTSLDLAAQECQLHGRRVGWLSELCAHAGRGLHPGVTAGLAGWFTKSHTARRGGWGLSDTDLVQLGGKPGICSICPSCGKPQSNQGRLALITHKA